MSVFTGCIPVISIPDNNNTLDELLPWSSFSLLVPPDQLYRLPHILSAVTPAAEARLRAGLRCAWRRLWFSSIYGACLGEDPSTDAFDGLLRVLGARAAKWRGDGVGEAGGGVAVSWVGTPDVDGCLAAVGQQGV
jgi:hypothetical protein